MAMETTMDRTPSPVNDDETKPEWSKREKLAMYLILVYNFVNGIIRDGLAPIVSVYLVSVKGWDPGLAGIVWLCRELSMMFVLIPMGDFIDKTKKKKALLMSATFVAALCSNIIIITDNFWVLAAKSVIEGIAASALDPGKAAITLGICGQKRFQKQSSKNEIANHSGYLFFAGLCGGIAYVIYPNTQWLFLAIGIAGIIGVISIYFIPRDLIKDDVARNIQKSKENEDANIVSYLYILKDVSIMMLVFSVFSFHLANASVLPLVGQVIANEGGRDGLTFATILIIVSRLVSIPTTWFAGKYSERIGYKLVLCIGYLSLTLRCGFILIISKFADNLRILTVTQILDGIGNGTINLSIITVTKVLTEGTGRYNVTFSLGYVAWMLGSSLSNLLGGFVANYSYNLAFIVLGAISIVPMIATSFGIKEPGKKFKKDQKQRVRSTSELKSTSRPYSAVSTVSSDPSDVDDGVIGDTFQ